MTLTPEQIQEARRRILDGETPTREEMLAICNTLRQRMEASIEKAKATVKAAKQSPPRLEDLIL